MTTKTKDWPGAASLFDSIPEGWRTVTPAAQLVGRDKDTLKRWRNEGVYEPSGYTIRGKLVVWLYSDEDIINMQKIASTMKVGRPRKGDQT